MMNNFLFETSRLTVRLAVPDDAELYYRLWTNPQVMANVGFPAGLQTSVDEIRGQIGSAGESALDHLLVVTLNSTGEAIGECFMSSPNAEGICETDVKLLPEYWGQRYGVEIKRGLLDYLFTHTLCTAVEATPNINNTASIKMQEAVGGKRVGESTTEFPESMRAYTVPVRHYIYRVYRENWQEGEHHG